MDKQQADQVFREQILSRWPDFKLSKALMGDWIDLISKFTAEQVSKAIKQYVLNFDSFRNPALNKFREIINAQNQTTQSGWKPKEETWPQYFLQCDTNDCAYWGYGTFTQINMSTNDPSICIKQMQQAKASYIQLYGGHWNIIVCNDLAERELLVKDRSEKNRNKVYKVDFPKGVEFSEGEIEHEIIEEEPDSLTDFFKDVI
jgi:hypothetical protein